MGDFAMKFGCFRLCGSAEDKIIYHENPPINQVKYLLSLNCH